MAGPGGREAGRVSIRVLPDTSLFARSLKRYLERMERTLVVRIPTELDDRHVQAQAKRLREQIERIPAELKIDADATRARTEIERAARDRRATIHVSVDRAQLRRIASEISAAVLSISRITVIGGAIGAALGAATQGALALGQSLVVAAGAIGALAPAAVLAAGAVGGVLAAAFIGLSDSTAPAVRELKAAVESLKGPFDNLRRQLRQNLFEGFAGEVRALANAYLPMLRARTEGIASSLNRMALSFAAAFRERRSVADTNTGLQNLQKALDRAAGGVRPLVQAFRDLAVVGSAFLPAMGAAFTSLSERFAAFIAEARRTGELKAFIQGGLQALSQLGEIARTVGSIFQSIYRAMEQSAGNVMGIMGRVLAEVDRFLSSSTGQATLVNVFRALNDIGAALAPTITAIAKAFGRLVPHFANLVEALGPALEAVLTELGDALVALAPELTTLMRAIAGGIAVVAPTLRPLAQAFGDIMVAVAPLIPTIANLAAILGGTLASVLSALAPAIQIIAEGLSTALAPVLPQIAIAFQQVAAALAPIAQDLALALVNVLMALAPMLPSVARAVGDLAVAFLTLVQALTPVLSAAVSLASTLLNATVVSAVTKLTSAISALARMFTSLVSTLASPTERLRAFASVSLWVRDTIRNVSDGISKAWNTVKATTTTAWAAVKVAISNAWSSIKASVSNALSQVSATLSARWASIRQSASQAWARVRTTISQAWSQIRTAVSQGIQRVVELVRQLPSRATGALKGIGRALYNSGRSLIGGFIDGIKSRISDVTSAVSAVVSRARDYFPFSPAKKGPFAGKGWTLYSGQSIAEALAEGMRMKATLVESAARRLAASAAPSLQPVTGAAVATANGAAVGGDTFVFNARSIDIDEHTLGPIIHAQRLRARVRRPR